MTFAEDVAPDQDIEGATARLVELHPLHREKAERNGRVACRLDGLALLEADHELVHRLVAVTPPTPTILCLPTGSTPTSFTTSAEMQVALAPVSRSAA